jgi:hypothetical protein
MILQNAEGVKQIYFSNPCRTKQCHSRWIRDVCRCYHQWHYSNSNIRTSNRSFKSSLSNYWLFKKYKTNSDLKLNEKNLKLQ